RRGLIEPGDRVLVALSGGLDSMVLLHLLRFHPPVASLRLGAAHLDHAMRGGSAADARWVAGVARAWSVHLRTERADPPPRDEAEARAARYDFLRRAREAEAADRIATAHHADDQAETVLFRAVRGTGVAGLRGIREWGPRGLIRPLLPFWREELAGYADAVGLGWRTDPTNRDPRHVRNVLRHRVLPLLEEEVAPGARRALARLARHARREERAWNSLLPDLLDGVVTEARKGRIVVAREGLLAYDSAVRARLVRAFVRRLGTVLDEAGTRVALEFTRSGPSGRGIDLAGGVRLRRDFDRFVFHRPAAGADAGASARAHLTIPGPEGGSGRLVVGGSRYDVRWGRALPEPLPGAECSGWTATFPVTGLGFPLRLREWRPGDRMRRRYGRKKLKKLFAEARVPAPERRRRPVLVDDAGTTLWVPGVARADLTVRGEPGESLILRIDHADHD
ncbi:MAG TPA: tRNA lysidine(34) synthetase TilS, partial [Longimicrobiales bacterium]|nr:tRNA lysidine(34) synthetase TilS [Longimicrobiales bacterium]